MFPQMFFSTSEQWGLYNCTVPECFEAFSFFIFLCLFLLLPILQIPLEAVVWTRTLRRLANRRLTKPCSALIESAQACQQATDWTWFCFDRNWKGLPTGGWLNLILCVYKTNFLAQFSFCLKYKGKKHFCFKSKPVLFSPVLRYTLCSCTHLRCDFFNISDKTSWYLCNWSTPSTFYIYSTVISLMNLFFIFSESLR